MITQLIHVASMLNEVMNLKLLSKCHFLRVDKLDGVAISVKR